MIAGLYNHLFLELHFYPCHALNQQLGAIDIIVNFEVPVII
jgi:hypothetical protein